MQRKLSKTRTAEVSSLLNGYNFKTGSIIGGNFEAIEEIGRGGYATVFHVKHTSTGAPYALKILLPQLLGTKSWLRFKAEAKVLSSLRHETLTKVYDISVHDNEIPYYTMDLITGETLEDLLIRTGPLTVAQALPIFIQLLEGLAYAHANGIIHRDLKPSNIMIESDDVDSKKITPPKIKILDFGISKMTGREDLIEQDLTRKGDVFGSPAYMSPEQSLGDKIDERSDIYSVGCTLFEMLTGYLPLIGESAIDTALLHQNQEAPQLKEVAPELGFGPAIENVVAKCLAKDPRERYQTASKMAEDLRLLKAGKAIAPPTIYKIPESTPANKQGNEIVFRFIGFASIITLFGLLTFAAIKLLEPPARPAVKAETESVVSRIEAEAAREAALGASQETAQELEQNGTSNESDSQNAAESEADGADEKDDLDIAQDNQTVNLNEPNKFKFPTKSLGTFIPAPLMERLITRRTSLHSQHLTIVRHIRTAREAPEDGAIDLSKEKTLDGKESYIYCPSRHARAHKNLIAAVPKILVTGLYLASSKKEQAKAEKGYPASLKISYFDDIAENFHDIHLLYLSNCCTKFGNSNLLNKFNHLKTLIFLSNNDASNYLKNLSKGLPVQSVWFKTNESLSNTLKYLHSSKSISLLVMEVQRLTQQDAAELKHFNNADLKLVVATSDDATITRLSEMNNLRNLIVFKKDWTRANFRNLASIKSLEKLGIHYEKKPAKDDISFLKAALADRSIYFRDAAITIK